jgi:hypothetical protein
MSSPDGIRTHATAVRGRRPRPLDDGAGTDPSSQHSSALYAHLIARRWNDIGKILLGVCHEVNMMVGECWYLDTRKRHRAINGGATERTHLVVDLEANAAVSALLCP